MIAHAGSTNMVYHTSPRLWRFLVIAAGTLILCSCRGPMHTASGPGSAMAPCPTLPPQAYAGMPGFSPTGAGPMAVAAAGMEAGVPLPVTAVGPWTPPGMSPPWPADEYLVDGGDSGQVAAVTRDWEIRGLEPEDTIAHYDTLDGRRVVEASNRVHIYSPRFGAVRHVAGLHQSEVQDSLADVHQPTKLVLHEETRGPLSRQQHLQAERQLGLDLANIYHSEQFGGGLSGATGVNAYHYGFQPFEDLAAIRQGIFDAPEMARLAESVSAAMIWSNNEMVEVILDHEKAAVETGDQRLAAIYTVKSDFGSSKLRITKVASASYAEPGEVIDFTLRFDNVGTEMIGNVTIVDNLTTRLEYVPDTAQCSVDAQFFTEPNEGDSLALRWEITNPLEPGEGGIVRFQCRVR